MDNDAKARAKQLFTEAVEKSAQERQNFLDQFCGSGGEVRQRVESLLSAYERAGELFGVTRCPDASTADRSATTATTGALPPAPGGTRIGPYKILQPIGEGGFGVVYMAEQERPIRRKVALKVIKLGMDTRQVVARFEAERQALAMMEHPNIAKVLDAGATDTGRPYFVMELVKGVPVTEYCDANRLDTAQRLELFLQVCRAVQHAHQKGIIHRDIKPSNVLVTLHDGVPVPKVIDFGIAKATGGRLTDKTLFTDFRQMVGTPAYMPPEQAEMSGLDVDTRSDVYSLGVLLYELLTGTTPFDGKHLGSLAYGEVQRIIREVDPPRPSTRLNTLGATLTAVAASRRTEPRRLGQLVRGELDWIVMKCLEKDRTRRYESVSALAADVQRHLCHDAVQAGPPTLRYRLRKLAMRNKGLLGTAAVVAAATVFGLVAATYGLLRANTERDKAVAAQRVEQEQRLAEWRAKRDAFDKLWDSYLAQARAGRWSGKVGRRFDGLRALRDAAQIRPALELRDEAIACMALVDLGLERSWQGRVPDPRRRAFDAPVERYALSDESGRIEVRRVADDRLLLELPGAGDPAGSFLRFSPDGRFLAVRYGRAGAERDFVVWRLDRREPCLKLTGVNHQAADFHPGGDSIAVGEAGGSVAIYNVSDGTLAARLPPELSARELRFDPSGRKLAVVTHAQTLLIRDAMDGRVTRKIALPSLAYAAAWHPGGRLLATASGCFHVHLWDAETGDSRAAMKGHQAEVVFVAFSHDGKYIASAGWDSAVWLWDAVTHEPVVRVMGLGGNLQFSRDNQLLAVTNNGDGTLWRVSGGGEWRTLHGHHGGDKSPEHVAFSRDGTLLATAGIDGVLLWDTATATRLAEVPTHSGALWVAFDPSQSQAPAGALLVGTRTGVQRWPIGPEGAAWPHSLVVGPPHKYPYGVGRAALSTDGRRLAVDAGSSVAAVIDDGDFNRARLTLKHPNLSTMALSPDGKWLATGTWHGTGIKVWDAENGEHVVDLPGTDGTAYPTFSPDGRWLVTGHFKHFQFWHVPSWQPAHRIAREAYSSMPGHVAFTADGGLMAVTFSNFVLKLFEPATGRQVATLEGPDAHFLGPPAFSPDGAWLAAPSGNHVVELWDLRLVRSQLASMGLDWPEVARPLADRAETTAPARVRVVAGGEDEGVTGDAAALVRLAVNVRLMSIAIEEQPNDPARYGRRAATLLRLARFKESAGDYARAVELKPDESLYWCRLACLQLYAGNVESYQQTCATMLRQFGPVADRDALARTARTCSLAPAGSEDAGRVASLLDRAAATDARVEGHPRYQVDRAMAEYRCGRFESAVSWVEKCRDRLQDPAEEAVAHLLAAMSHHRLGQAERAAEAWRRAEKMVESEIPAAGRDDLGRNAGSWLMCHILRREARAVLGGGVGDLAGETQSP